MIEKHDYFDENMKHLGVATRDEIHSNGYWHQSFHCWIIREDKNNHYVVFQRRGPHKRVYPNKLDITAAGHLTAGESPRDGLRELEEELGIYVDFESLVPLGIKFDLARTDSVVNREFCHVYLLKDDRSLDSYKLQIEEVTGIVQVELNDGLKLFSGEIERVLSTGYQVDEKNNKKAISIQISKEDVIPRVDKYYLKIFIMAERYILGSKYLAI